MNLIVIILKINLVLISFSLDAGLSSEQGVEEASADTIIFKPVEVRSLFALEASAGHLIATSHIMGAPAT